MPAKTKKKVLEKDIQKEILTWLETTGLLYWRQNSGKAPIFHNGKIIRMVDMGREGLPDIIVIWPPEGHFVGLEVKKPDGRQSPSQKTMQKLVEKAGGVYKIVRSLEETKSVLKGLV